MPKLVLFTSQVNKIRRKVEEMMNKQKRLIKIFLKFRKAEEDYGHYS